MAGIAAAEAGQRVGHRPHVLDAAGMHAEMAVAEPLALAAVQGAQGRLDRGVGAEAGRPDHRAHHLAADRRRSEEHTSELQSLMRISYAVFCLKKKTTPTRTLSNHCTTQHNCMT